MDFCRQMVKHMILDKMKEPISKNIIVSPLSFNVLLNMIAAGMSGDSLELMLNKLKSQSVEDINKKSCQILSVVNNTDQIGPVVTSINGIWVDKSCQLKASYKELLKRIYNCQANKNCDFANKEPEIRNAINSWAETASKGLIKNVLNKKLDPLTKFVQANALYFKGSWSNPFNPNSTSNKPFHLLDETTVQVPFLIKGNKYYDYGSFDGYTVLRLPYENGQNTSFSMYFFLPEEKDGLSNFLETLNFQTIENMKLSETNLELVQIPKFKFSYEINASETMKNMGLEMPYKGNKLDYAEMMQFPENLPQLFSTIVIQKAFIEIDEYGTEASAVSIGIGVPSSMWRPKPEPKPRFVADHPFMFVIKEDVSRLVLFTGIVLKPDSSEMQPKIPPSNPREHERYRGMGGPQPNFGFIPPPGTFVRPRAMMPPQPQVENKKRKQLDSDE